MRNVGIDFEIDGEICRLALLLLGIVFMSPLGLMHPGMSRAGRSYVRRGSTDGCHQLSTKEGSTID